MIGSCYCCGILLAGLQAEVAAIIFSPASSPGCRQFCTEERGITAFGKKLLKKEGSNEKMGILIKKGGKWNEWIKDKSVCNGFVRPYV
jgi:hypothetical protein